MKEASEAGNVRGVSLLGSTYNGTQKFTTVNIPAPLTFTVRHQIILAFVNRRVREQRVAEPSMLALTGSQSPHSLCSSVIVRAAFHGVMLWQKSDENLRPDCRGSANE